MKAGDFLYSPACTDEDSTRSVIVPKRVILPQREASGEAGAQLFSGHATARIPDAVAVDSALCRLLGYLAGDGHATRSGGAQVMLFLGADQKAEWVDDALSCMRASFGVEGIALPHKTKRMVTVKWGGSALAWAFRSWLYTANDKKRLPQWAMRLSRPLTEEVLKGLWRTDGSVYHETRRSGGRIASVVSASPYLIGQTRTLLARLGYRTKIKRRAHANGAESFYLQFSAADTFLDYVREKRNGNSSTFTRHVDDGQEALVVRVVERVPYSGLVYSLEVDEDHSYEVGGFSVHNCVSGSEAIAAGCWPVARLDDALAEVYAGYVQPIPSAICDDAWRARFADAIIHALKADVNPYAARSAEFCRLFTWEAAGRALERACQLPVTRPDVPEGRWQAM